MKVTHYENIIEDKKDGYWKLYYPSGDIQGEASYKNGSGEYNEYYPSGSRKSEGNILNGKKQGQWYYYSEGGSLEGEANYDQGEGEYTGYYPDSTIKMKGVLLDDKRIGEWTLFNPDGSQAGTYRPIYEDETPIFKTRISEDEVERELYEKPDYKYKKRGLRYFEPTINEYHGVIIATNPLWLLDNQLPIAVEYYMQERLGYELQVSIVRDPLFKSHKDVAIDQVYKNGIKANFRQKFYSTDGYTGMVYFGHQLIFHRIDYDANLIDPTIVNGTVTRKGRLIESGFGYGLLIGNRWMKNVGNSGLTIDGFFGANILLRNFKKDYEPQPVLDGYFDDVISSELYFPITIGVNIGFVGPKSKSKTQ